MSMDPGYKVWFGVKDTGDYETLQPATEAINAAEEDSPYRFEQDGVEISIIRPHYESDLEGIGHVLFSTDWDWGSILLSEVIEKTKVSWFVKDAVKEFLAQYGLDPDTADTYVTCTYG